MVSFELRPASEVQNIISIAIRNEEPEQKYCIASVAIVVMCVFGAIIVKMKKLMRDLVAVV